MLAGASEHVVDLDTAQAAGAHRLVIWVPPVEAPTAGFPVLWVLDGSGYRGLAVDMVRNRGVVAAEIDPAVVVSVSYADDRLPVWMARRFYDFTPTVPAPGRGREGLQHGGLEALLDLLAGPALAAVAARVAIARDRMAIFGHSMGGLAVLHALFTRPAMFRSWLAVSPAVHWNARELLQHEAGFARWLATATEAQAPRVFIAAGALEQAPLVRLPPGVPDDGGALLTRINAGIAAERYVDDAAELAARLRALPGPPGWCVQHRCPAEETHMSVPFAVMRPALDLAFARSGA